MRLKRLAASKHMSFEKKTKKFIVSPRAGPHSKKRCIPLAIIVRDILGYAKTAKEAKKIIKMGNIKVDGIVRKDHKYPTGLMDVIEIAKINKYFRILLQKGKLTVSKISKNEAKQKLCQIKNKTTLKGGNLQLNLHDGKNIIIMVKNPKKCVEDKYKTGDTLIISLPDQKIKEQLEMKKGNLAMVMNGKYAGVVGKITKITILQKMKSNRIRIKSKEGEIKTLKNYAFVIGKDKSKIEVIL